MVSNTGKLCVCVFVWGGGGLQRTSISWVCYYAIINLVNTHFEKKLGEIGQLCPQQGLKQSTPG